MLYRSTHAIAIVGCTFIATSVHAGERLADVIFTNIDGHPTAQIPGLEGEQFRAPLIPFLTLNHSQFGTNWIMKTFSDNPDSDANDVMVVGSGLIGEAVAREGDPVPIFNGLIYGFFDSDCGINEAGEYIVGNRLQGNVGTDMDEALIIFDNKTTSLIREGLNAPGLFDLDPMGDELFGNSLNSAHMLLDSTPAFHADQIQNVASDFQSALYHGVTPVAQEGTMTNDGATYGGFSALAGGAFKSSGDGSAWIVEVDLQPGLGTIEGAVVTGDVVVQQGQALSGLRSVVADVFAVEIGTNGDWMVRGENTNEQNWVIFNGDVVAVTGDSITPGASENWSNADVGATFLAIAANASGQYLIAGGTDAGDQVLVASDDNFGGPPFVVARSGDAIDLDGNGMADDDVFIDTFNADDVFFTDDFNDDLVDDRVAYFLCSIRDGRGADLGDAFVRMPFAQGIEGPLGDLDGDGDVDGQDLLMLLNAWGQPGPTDLDGSGTTGGSDLLILLNNWG